MTVYAPFPSMEAARLKSAQLWDIIDPSDGGTKYLYPCLLADNGSAWLEIDLGYPVPAAVTTQINALSGKITFQQLIDLGVINPPPGA